MSKQYKSRATMAALCWLMLLACMVLSGCGSVEVLRPIEGNNCVDKVLEMRQDGDQAYLGYYANALIERGEAHAWLKRDGTCYDNMNPKGFDCNSELYRGWAVGWNSEAWKIAYRKRG